MYVRLGSFLQELEAIESAKPKERQRPVPTHRELAEAAGINPVSLSKLVRGRTGSLSLEIGAKILDELNRRGFEANPNDILGYQAPAKTMH